MSQKFSRRDYLSRVGHYAAALLGVTFVQPIVSPSSFGKLRSAATCTHETTEPDACNKASGIKCGFHNSNDCAKFANNSTCPKCTIDANGCPGGTAIGSRWAWCCACKEDATMGETIQYWDCCGSALSTNCAACMNVDSCSGPDANCPLSWCGTTSGTPLCTFLKNTNKTCIPT